MNFLFDTNVVIALEPTALSDVEESTEGALELVKLIQSNPHKLLLHPASLDEMARDGNEHRRAVRQLLLQKYAVLTRPPVVSADLREKLGEPNDSNSAIDDRILAAVHADAVHHLVTEDRGIHRKARLLGLDEAVLTVNGALGLLRRLHPDAPEPPPSVQARVAYELDVDDPIFDSFRSDYGAEFDGWMAKARQESRPVWTIEQDGDLAAVCIIKDERAGNDLGLPGATLKLSSLKASEKHAGHKYGELLLRTVFDYAHQQGYEHLYLTVFEKHDRLIALLEDFGFEIFPDRTSRLDEIFMHKPLRPTANVPAPDNALEYHRRFGPPSVSDRPPATYVIPIKPTFHAMLFPSAQTQMALDLGDRAPYGNAIKKAYLCHAVTRELTSGATVAFYRSADLQSVDVVGVVEETLRSSDPDEIAKFVGTRTVYSLDAITQMCARREVLSILFRHDRELPEPLGLAELTSNGVLAAAPQSIVKIGAEGAAWLHSQLG